MYESSEPTTGVTLDVPQASVDDLTMLARLMRRPVGEVFAEAVEHVRTTYVPATKPARSAEPRAPRTPKATK